MLRRFCGSVAPSGWSHHGSTTIRRCSKDNHSAMVTPQIVTATSSAAEQLKEMRRMTAKKDSPSNGSHPPSENNAASSSLQVFVFPSWALMSLPSLMGKHRGNARTALASSDELKDTMSHTLSVGVDAASHASKTSCVVVGCRSIKYLERMLQHDEMTSILVVDHELDRLVEAAFYLRPRYGSLVSFARADVPFLFHSGIIAPQSVDTVVFALPVPHASKQASHRRLLTRDVFNLIHPTIRVRTSAEDPRGIVAFTDHRGYAEFAAQQLEESKMVVPWARKKPSVFSRWLPVDEDAFPSPKGCLNVDGNRSPLHVVTAAKSAATTDYAMKVIQEYDFCRRYYDAFTTPQHDGDDSQLPK